MTLVTLASGNVNMNENEKKKSIVVDIALARLRRRALVREGKAKPKRITIADVLTVFPGARIVNENGDEEPSPPSPDRSNCLRCEHCDKPHIPAWRRGGKIIMRVWPDGRREWACNYCGRAARVLIIDNQKKDRRT